MSSFVDTFDQALRAQNLYDIEELEKLVDAPGSDIAPSPSGYLHYVLDDQGQPVPTNDMGAVGRCFDDAEGRTVAKTRLVFRGLAVEISTVFMVINHGMYRADPVLWGTMILSKCADLQCFQLRYESRDAAQRGHWRIVEYVECMMCRRRPVSNRRRLVAERRRLRAQRGGRR